MKSIVLDILKETKPIDMAYFKHSKYECKLSGHDEHFVLNIAHSMHNPSYKERDMFLLPGGSVLTIVKQLDVLKEDCNNVDMFEFRNTATSGRLVELRPHSSDILDIKDYRNFKTLALNKDKIGSIKVRVVRLDIIYGGSYYLNDVFFEDLDGPLSNVISKDGFLNILENTIYSAPCEIVLKRAYQLCTLELDQLNNKEFSSDNYALTDTLLMKISVLNQFLQLAIDNQLSVFRNNDKWNLMPSLYNKTIVPIIETALKHKNSEHRRPGAVDYGLSIIQSIEEQLNSPSYNSRSPAVYKLPAKNPKHSVTVKWDVIKNSITFTVQDISRNNEIVSSGCRYNLLSDANRCISRIEPYLAKPMSLLEMLKG